MKRVKLENESGGYRFDRPCSWEVSGSEVVLVGAAARNWESGRV